MAARGPLDKFVSAGTHNYGVGGAGNMLSLGKGKRASDRAKAGGGAAGAGGGGVKPTAQPQQHAQNTMGNGAHDAGMLQIDDNTKAMLQRITDLDARQFTFTLYKLAVEWEEKANGAQDAATQIALDEKKKRKNIEKTLKKEIKELEETMESFDFDEQTRLEEELEKGNAAIEEQNAYIAELRGKLKTLDENAGLIAMQGQKFKQLCINQQKKIKELEDAQDIAQRQSQLDLAAKLADARKSGRADVEEELKQLKADLRASATNVADARKSERADVKDELNAAEKLLEEQGEANETELKKRAAHFEKLKVAEEEKAAVAQAEVGRLKAELAQTTQAKAEASEKVKSLTTELGETKTLLEKGADERTASLHQKLRAARAQLRSPQENMAALYTKHIRETFSADRTRSTERAADE